MFKDIVFGWLHKRGSGEPDSSTEMMADLTATPTGQTGAAIMSPLGEERIELPVGYDIQEYRIEKVLGVGGFGITYRALDTGLAESVALKEYMPMGMACRPDGLTVTLRSADARENFRIALQSFLDEAKTLARIRNYNVVRVRRLFREHNTAYMVMDFEEGQELKALMKKGGSTLEEGELMGMLTPLLDGLAAIHEKGILHRDIKPSNIFIRTDGSPLLIDFGAAVSRRSKESQEAIFVTPGYSPVEQYTDPAAQGPWTDIYAMGATLYEMVTGHRPEKAPERQRALEEEGHDPLPPVAQAARGSYSASLLAFIQAALAVDHRRRPASVQAWRGAHFDAKRSSGTLYDGQKQSCEQVDPTLKRIRVGLGWDGVAGEKIDLDASALLLGANGKVRSDGDFIFYNNLASPCGAVRHLGDNPDGVEKGDNEIIQVDLARVPDDVQMILFAVTIHAEDHRRGRTFGEVENAFIRIMNDESGVELFNYNLSRRYSSETAITIGEIYRHRDQWIFGADSKGFAGGLEALVGFFGVEVE